MNPTAHLSALGGLVAAGIIEAHHPGISGSEIVDLEIGIAALQTHTETTPDIIR